MDQGEWCWLSVGFRGSTSDFGMLQGVCLRSVKNMAPDYVAYYLFCAFWTFCFCRCCSYDLGRLLSQVSKDERGRRLQFSNESMQVEQLLSFVNRVENFTHIIAGYSVMEWVDEWWKTATDFKNPNCPNHRSDLHTFCAHYVNSGDDLVIAIHEEWLGIWTQTLPEKARSTVSYCIQPKLAYFALVCSRCMRRSVFIRTTSLTGSGHEVERIS